MDLSSIIIKPIITEKSMSLTASGVYTFAVGLSANKNQIKEAVERQFKVKVINIKTIIIKGKTKLTGRLRKKTRRSGFKKAVVKLAKDQKIEMFESLK